MTFAPPRETKNPFASAEVVGRQFSPTDYHTKTGKRGDPDYIMSRGELCEFLHCPSRWIAGYESKDTEASEWGSLMDALLLDPEHLADHIAVAPAMYPCEPTKKDPRTEKPWNFNATYCAEWKEKQGDKLIVKNERLADAERAVSRLLRDPDIKTLLATSDKQVHVLAEYHDKATGLTIPVKALIDIVPPIDSDFGQGLFDFKTAYSAASFAWTRAVFEHNYHTQAALYLDAYTVATGEDRTDFMHIIQESYFPFEPGKRFLSLEYVELGRLKYITALERYAQCLSTGQWPGYETDERKLNVRGFELCEPEPFMFGRS